METYIRKPLACNSALIVMRGGVRMRFHPGIRGPSKEESIPPSYYPYDLLDDVLPVVAALGAPGEEEKICTLCDREAKTGGLCMSCYNKERRKKRGGK